MTDSPITPRGQDFAARSSKAAWSSAPTVTPSGKSSSASSTSASRPPAIGIFIFPCSSRKVFYKRKRSTSKDSRPNSLSSPSPAARNWKSLFELGPRDVSSGNIVLKRRDTGTKEVIPQTEAVAKLAATLEAMQRDLYSNASSPSKRASATCPWSTNLTAPENAS